MYKNGIIIWLILFCCQPLLGQVKEDVDSLKNLLKHDMNDISRIDLLNKIAANVYYENPDEIDEYAREALEIAQQINYEEGIAHAYNNLGIYYRSKSIYNKAIDYFFNSLQIMESLNDSSGIARSYNLIGIIHYYLGNYDISLDYYLKALEINKKQNDKKWIAGNSNNVGMIYELKEEYEKALEYYLLSLEMNLSLGNENWVANTYGNIGSLYLKMNNPLSLEFFKRRLGIKQKLNDLNGISRSNYLIGTYYMKQQNYTEAIPYFKEGHRIAKETGSLYDLQNTSEELSKAYEALNQYDRAYQFHKLFKKYNDSLNLEQNTQKITKLHLQNEYRKEHQLLQLQHQRNRLKHGLVSLGLLSLVLLTIYLIYRQRSIARQNKLNRRKLQRINQNLADELKFKEKLLEDNINYMVNKNEIIMSTVEKLNTLKKSIEAENQQIINEVILELKSGVNEDLWEEFEVRFKQIHSEFYEKLNLKFPTLTGNEIKLCAFLKLNLKSKDIAAITKQSIKSVETARSRLRRKLDISSREISLSEYLNSL